MSKILVKASKFMSLLLRHKPEAVGLSLNHEGWAAIDELTERTANSDPALTRELILKVVSTSDKQRFAVSADGEFVRANQGHSILVNLSLEPKTPPDVLFHGTATRFLNAIRASGLLKGKRHHVHLSADVTTAVKVGQRHGNPVVLEVAAAAMSEEGHPFFLSQNGVWLTEHVPPKYLAEAE